MQEKIIKFTQKHLDYLQQNHIYFGTNKRDTPWLTKGMMLKFKERPILEPFSAFKKCKGFFSLGSYSHTGSTLEQGVVAGRYCSFGHHISIMPLDHPLSRLSTCGFDCSSYPIFDDYLSLHGKSIKQTEFDSYKPMPVIGHDVWIGNHAVLKRGITIGNGAVIAAHAVVTKDVPPYAVVAGVPAVVKKYRFSEEIIKKLLAIKWPEYELADFCHLDTVNIEAFIDGFEKLLDTGKLRKYQPRKINIVEELSALSSKNKIT